MGKKHVIRQALSFLSCCILLICSPGMTVLADAQYNDCGTVGTDTQTVLLEESTEVAEEELVGDPDPETGNEDDGDSGEYTLTGLSDTGGIEITFYHEDDSRVTGPVAAGTSIKVRVSLASREFVLEGITAGYTLSGEEHTDDIPFTGSRPFYYGQLIMPSADTTVTVSYRRTNMLFTEKNGAAGNLSLDLDYADVGETVQITASGIAGETEIISLTVSYLGNGSIQTLSYVPDTTTPGQFTFVMPDARTVVTAEFAPCSWTALKTWTENAPNGTIIRCEADHIMEAG